MNFERIFLVSALAVTLAAFVTIIVGAVSNTASINDNIRKTFSEVNATASPAHTVLPRVFTVPLTSGTPRRTCCAGCSTRRLFHRLFAVRPCRASPSPLPSPLLSPLPHTPSDTHVPLALAAS